MKTIKYIITALFFVLIVHENEAAHIVGGDVNYTFVRFSNDSSRVTFSFEINMYRDQFSGGAPFDAPANFGIFQRNTYWGVGQY